MVATTAALRLSVGILVSLIFGGYVGIIAVDVPAREWNLVPHHSIFRRIFGPRGEGVTKRW